MSEILTSNSPSTVPWRSDWAWIAESSSTDTITLSEAAARAFSPSRPRTFSSWVTRWVRNTCRSA
ncbi:MAG: hypothetical protein EOM37_19230 [Proteobacteria bacterium]|nr:hypothetical protein [Pseudomonadota bacterium]